MSLGIRGSLYEQQASTPQLAPAIDPNGVEHIRSLGFGGGGRTVDNNSEHYGFSLNHTAAEGHEFGFDYDNSHQEYDNTPEFNLETGEIIYPLGTRDSIESIWQSRRGQVNPRAGYAAEQEFDREWWALTYDGKWTLVPLPPHCLLSTPKTMDVLCRLACQNVNCCNKCTMVQAIMRA